MRKSPMLTFSIEEYPGILAYYLKCGLDVAPIEKRYNELIRETENETVLNPIEEQVKHNMIMKKYLGYVLKQNLYYYRKTTITMFAALSNIAVKEWSKNMRTKDREGKRERERERRGCIRKIEI